MIEATMARIEASLNRVEREIDVAVNYARASAQAAGLIERSREDYKRLDEIWKHLTDERKASEG